ncbi:hypothetical protein KEM55_002088 [Ascosphaera atra]|nr:hypothetical protein KEM55_002088 [Ascosphaera atra]
MSDELTGVRPSEVEFHGVLKRYTGEISNGDKPPPVILKVSVRGLECAMKIYHGEVREYDEEYIRPICELEATAYRRLRDRGVCKAGFVPEFLGVIEKLPSRGWSKEIKKILDEEFWEDERPQSALFLKFIPDMQPIRLSNCSEERLRAARRALEEIHRAHICHNDIFARNIAVTPERTLFIDFDVSKTFPERPLKHHEREKLKEDTEFLDELEDIMV